MDTKDFLEFGPYRVDSGRRVLLRDGQLVPLPGKAFELLALLQNAGDTVSKDELIKAVWPDTFIEEGKPNTGDFCIAEGARGSGKPVLHRHHSAARLLDCGKAPHSL